MKNKTISQTSAQDLFYKEVLTTEKVEEGGLRVEMTAMRRRVMTGKKPQLA